MEVGAGVVEAGEERVEVELGGAVDGGGDETCRLEGGEEGSRCDEGRVVGGGLEEFRVGYDGRLGAGL